MIGERTPDCRVLVISEEDDLEIRWQHSKPAQGGSSPGRVLFTTSSGACRRFTGARSSSRLGCWGGYSHTSSDVGTTKMRAPVGSPG